MLSISEEIESGDLKLARKRIEEMEARLAEEASPKLHEALKTQISSLKREYSAKVSAGNNDIPETARRQGALPREIDINIRNEFGGNEVKYVLADVENEHIAPLQHTDVDVVNCKRIQVDMIDCEETVFIKNVSESEIHVKTKYLRLLGCTELHLKIHSYTAVYMQSSKAIRIEAIGCSQPCVFDFDSPVNSQNYQLI